MANFKRNKPKARTPGRVKSMSSWPRSWDVLMHTRPGRRRASAVTKAILNGTVDPDNATYNPSHKPHVYYW